MSPEQLIQLALTGGAAGVSLWVLRLVTEGKLHSSSEVDGLKQDKIELQQTVVNLTDALKASSEGDKEILRVLRSLPLRLFDEGLG